MMTLGSLFDGSGGFPLAGAMHGIKPVWASEIEPYPIRVTKARFPDMEHLGSVLDVEGDQITPVDIITFGSTCQDLSVAGKQKGIHEGFPDWWEDGVEGSDSARYKMWGNGIALPCAADVLGRIARESQRNKEK